MELINTDEVDETRGRFKDAEWMTNPLNIIVGGAGGIGSWVSLFLSRIGHSLTIYDMDVYESHNMSGQFINQKAIGENKAEALKNIISDFNGRFSNTITTMLEYNNDSFTNNIVFSCFDNMEARKTMFNKWFQYIKDNPEKRKDSVFIDGRLLAEQYQIFTVQGHKINQIKEYNRNLFDDSEAEVEQCTLKQTSHIAAMIGANMTSIFNNWIVNNINNMEMRTVPFYQEHYSPVMYNTMDIL